MSNPERLTEQVVIRVTKETKSRLEAIAEQRGVKHTAFTRELVEKGLKRFKDK
jgi:predicted DNA-binding protein